MQKYYKEHSERMKTLTYHETHQGKFCVAKIDDIFYRAKIITPTATKIHLIDEGQNLTVRFIKKIKPNVI